MLKLSRCNFCIRELKILQGADTEMSYDHCCYNQKVQGAQRG